MRFPETLHRHLPRAVVLGVVAAAVALGVVACSASGDAEMAAAGSPGTGTTGGTTSGPSGSGGGGQDASLDISSDSDPTPVDPNKPYAALCGDGTVCTPGADNTTCDVGGGAGGGQSGAGGSASSCKLLPNDGEAVAVCAPAGGKLAGQPCMSAADCADGLGCAAGNVCRPYCCGDVELCPAGTYCAPTPMAEDTSASPAPVPLCVPATNCQLLADTCGDGLTCTIVRNDGTTSCVVPGQGKLCEPCDCAAGFVCSKSTNQCHQLCSLDGQLGQPCPAGSYCQAGSMSYPQNIGVCVGGPQGC